LFACATGARAGERGFYQTPEGRAALGGAVQDTLDRWRARDVAAELARRGARASGGGGASLIRTASSGDESDAGWFDAPRSSRAPSVVSGAAEDEPPGVVPSAAAPRASSAAEGAPGLCPAWSTLPNTYSMALTSSARSSALPPTLLCMHSTQSCP
jgi:hypothetical protein